LCWWLPSGPAKFAAKEPTTSTAKRWSSLMALFNWLLWLLLLLLLLLLLVLLVLMLLLVTLAEQQAAASGCKTATSVAITAVSLHGLTGAGSTKSHQHHLGQLLRRAVHTLKHISGQPFH
jgi:uncharacterized SAM-binding protein YcdF (DUF218 family)